METYRSGHNGAHSKCVSLHGLVGSNPTVSVILSPHKSDVYAGLIYLIYWCLSFGKYYFKCHQTVFTVHRYLRTVWVCDSLCNGKTQTVMPGIIAAPFFSDRQTVTFLHVPSGQLVCETALSTKIVTSCSILFSSIFAVISTVILGSIRIFFSNVILSSGSSVSANEALSYAIYTFGLALWILWSRSISLPIWFPGESLILLARYSSEVSEGTVVLLL